MKRILILAGAIGSSGIVATGTWFTYDTINPTLINMHETKWSPIKIELNKPNNGTEESYQGAGCFKRFFGITIEKFNKNPSGSSETQTKETIFKDSNSK